MLFPVPPSPHTLSCCRSHPECPPSSAPPRGTLGAQTRVPLSVPSVPPSPWHRVYKLVLEQGGLGSRRGQGLGELTLDTETPFCPPGRCLHMCLPSWPGGLCWAVAWAKEQKPVIHSEGQERDGRGGAWEALLQPSRQDPPASVGMLPSGGPWPRATGSSEQLCAPPRSVRKVRGCGGPARMRHLCPAGLSWPILQAALLGCVLRSLRTSISESSLPLTPSAVHNDLAAPGMHATPRRA